MQDAILPTLQVAMQNRYPDCLEITSLVTPLDSQPLVLFLTAKFGDRWEPLLGGRVKFGLKGGQLRVRLPEGTREVSESQRDVEFPGLRVRAEVIGKNEQLWRWVAEKGQILQGTAKFKLAEFSAVEGLDKWEAVFSVEAADIAIAQTEELWKHDITPNQHAVLDRAIAKFLTRYRLSPYLSALRVETPPTPIDETSALDALQQTIVEFSTGKSDNFLELAAIAKLDSARDLAGGNLMATDLSGLDLSGTNLERVNLRGANLNDTDFSEASLTAAKLMGADLSGAYLGNTNLCQANLHRASLALANLGGADASGANFQEVNLSNTNLAGVKVEEAIFGQNPGLTEETHKSLLARGAIFKED